MATAFFFGAALALRAAGFFAAFFPLPYGFARAVGVLALEDFLETLAFFASGFRGAGFFAAFFSTRFAFFAAFAMVLVLQ